MKCYHFSRLLVSLLVLIIVLVLSSCENRKPIKIAFIGAISGSSSEIGVSARNGSMQMIDQVNSTGGVNGRKLQLDVFDNKGNPSICRNIFKQLNEQNYNFIIGPLFSKMADVTLEAVDKGDVLIVSPTMSTELLSNRDDLFIRTVSTINPQAELLADYAGKQKSKTVSIVYDTSNEKLTVGLYKAFIKNVEDDGISITSIHSINRNEKTDFVALAKQISIEDPESILLCMSALDAAYLAQQLKTIHFKPKQYYGISWTQTNDLLTHGGEAVEGMILIAVFKSDKNKHEVKSFKSQYESRYGKEASFPSILGYTAVSVLIKGLENSESLSPIEVKKTILKKSPYQILDSPININSFGDALGNYSLVKVKNNYFVPLNDQ